MNNTNENNPTAQGVDEITDFSHQLARFKDGPLAQIERVIEAVETMAAGMEKAGLHDGEFREITDTLKDASRSLREEIADILTNLQVVSSLTMTVALAMARINTKVNALSAAGTKAGGQA